MDLTQYPNKKRIRLLVDALRSGRYQQGFGRLATQRTTQRGKQLEYCCLGVACEVAKDHGLPLDTKVSPLDQVLYADVSNVLPESVRDWYGFDTEDPLLRGGSSSRRSWWKFWEKPKEPVLARAITLNDDMRLPFHDIAAAFERTYL